MDEFERIAAFFAPLSLGVPSAFALGDDAAVLEGQKLVISTDTIIEGVHYFGSEPADMIARKLLRCNLSDLAAKGAKPLYYSLNLSLTARQGDDWLAGFSDGLRHDQTHYGMHLIGGDSTRYRGPYYVLSATVYGEASAYAYPARSKAQIGDAVCVTGTLGDAAAGLHLLKQRELGDIGGLESSDYDFLTARYFLPQPRVEAGLALAPFMHAGMDISDGLMQDAGHIARQSGVGMRLKADSLPLSSALRNIITSGGFQLEDAVSGGDDYEILCTVSPTDTAGAQAACAKVGTTLSVIGQVVAGDGVQLLGADGVPISLKKLGYQHR